MEERQSRFTPVGLIRRLNLLRTDRRRYPRKACFVYVDYAVRGRSYNDAVNNISQGGACIRTQRPFHPGDEIRLEFPLLGLSGHVEGLITWAGLRSIGIEFKSVFVEAKGVRYDFGFVGEDVVCREKEVSEMGKIRKRTVRWEPSADAKKHRLYWSTQGPVGYESDFVELENKTQVILPDEVISFPRIAGDIELGITAVNAIGNESDITRLKAYVDFTVPEAPKLLTVEE
ncbi:MAG: PilZ domain-containing protein [Deltaproteobacteria bacterium]